VANIDFTKTYPEHLAALRARLGNDEAFQAAIGGDFVAVGKLEYHLLRSLGLADGHLVVDVGCGSGRLACQLAPFEGIRYLGTDVVGELLDYARKLTKRPDWDFVQTNGVSIPCGNNIADYAVFFSVFTHLLHEETFRYFLETARILKPGGFLVFSFLEFRISCHWATFIASVGDVNPGKHLNQFLDRDAIAAWAENSGFSEPQIFDGDRGHIPIPEEIRWDNGNRMGTLGNLGQSVAILRKL
jgi:SAM-dependent methyltransferase